MKLEKVTYDGNDYHLTDATCYRTWQVAFGFKIGRCGYCGEHPTIDTSK